MDRLFFQIVDKINKLPFSNMLEVKVLSLAKGLCKLRVNLNDNPLKSFSETDSWLLYIFCDLAANAASSTLATHRRGITPLVSHVKILSFAGSKSFYIESKAFEEENGLVSSKVNISDDSGKTLANAMHIYQIDRNMFPT